MVSNHESVDSKAAVFSYTIPDDIFNGTFKRVTIGTGFENAWSLTASNMAPGYPYAVRPNQNDKKSQLYVVIAGDGDHSVEMLRPNGIDSYTLETIKNEGGTVGSLAFADLDGDGWLEFFVPNYDGDYIEVY